MSDSWLCCECSTELTRSQTQPYEGQKPGTSGLRKKCVCCPVLDSMRANTRCHSRQRSWPELLTRAQGQGLPAAQLHGERAPWLLERSTHLPVHRSHPPVGRAVGQGRDARHRGRWPILQCGPFAIPRSPDSPRNASSSSSRRVVGTMAPADRPQMAAAHGVSKLIVRDAPAVRANRSDRRERLHVDAGGLAHDQATQGDGRHPAHRVAQPRCAICRPVTLTIAQEVPTATCVLPSRRD